MAAVDMRNIPTSPLVLQQPIIDQQLDRTREMQVPTYTITVLTFLELNFNKNVIHLQGPC